MSANFDLPLVVFDCENANSGGPPHLLELGAVRVVDGEVVDHFESLVRPEIPIDPAASEVHGIDDMDVREASGADEVLPDFFEWLGDDWLCAHRAESDCEILAFECARHGILAPSQPAIDSLPIARKLLPEAPDHKLETLCHYLNFEEGPHHRALADAVWCWKVLEVCVERMDAPDAEDAAEDGSRSLTSLLNLCRSGGGIAQGGPQPGSLKPRHRKLSQALRNQGVVTLLYGEESSEPVPLRVRPRLIYRRGARSYVEGECQSSGLLKTYRIDRVHRVLTH